MSCLPQQAHKARDEAALTAAYVAAASNVIGHKNYNGLMVHLKHTQGTASAECHIVIDVLSTLTTGGALPLAANAAWSRVLFIPAAPTAGASAATANEFQIPFAAAATTVEYKSVFIPNVVGEYVRVLAKTDNAAPTAPQVEIWVENVKT